MSTKNRILSVLSTDTPKTASEIQMALIAKGMPLSSPQLQIALAQLSQDKKIRYEAWGRNGQILKYYLPQQN